MNEVRRKQLDKIILRLNDSRDALEEINADLNEIVDAQVNALETMPISFQESEKGKKWSLELTH